jgi:phosphatidylglycerophosphate synthase
MKYMKKRKGKATGKGIYILPNLLTTISLLSGFYAIISAFDRRFAYAAIAIFVSCLFDMLDGRVARLTHSTSRFGVEYDSLSDVIAFGVAPGVLVYVWLPVEQSGLPGLTYRLIRSRKKAFSVFLYQRQRQQLRDVYCSILPRGLTETLPMCGSNTGVY